MVLKFESVLFTRSHDERFVSFQTVSWNRSVSDLFCSLGQTFLFQGVKKSCNFANLFWTSFILTQVSWDLSEGNRTCSNLNRLVWSNKISVWKLFTRSKCLIRLSEQTVSTNKSHRVITALLALACLSLHWTNTTIVKSLSKHTWGGYKCIDCNFYCVSLFQLQTKFYFHLRNSFRNRKCL